MVVSLVLRRVVAVDVMGLDVVTAVTMLLLLIDV